MNPISEQEAIKRWRHDLPLFVKQIFHAEPTEQQLEFLNAVVAMVWAKIKCHTFNKNGKLPFGPISDHEKKLNSMFGQSIMAGVGTGKGATASWIIVWFLTCFGTRGSAPKVVVTSSSAKQLSITIWAELAKWHSVSAIKEFFTLQSDKFFLTEEGGKTWFAATRTANAKNSADEQAETLAGLHEDFLLIIADEASGIADPVFRPLESTLTGKCNLCLLFFNPTKSKGFAIDTHHRDRENWMQHRWNAEECPRVSQDSIDRLARKYGKDSNSYRIRVLGLPPTSGENYIIPWDSIESAVDRDIEALPTDILLYSMDVGAGGDDNVIVPIRGPIVLPLLVSNFEDSNKLAEWAVDAIAVGEPEIMLVDNIGIGWAVPNAIRDRMPRGTCDIVELNVAQSAFNPNRFYRMRDELWWRLREAFEQGRLSIPNDPLLMGDLNSPRYTEVAGKIKVETKKEMVARGIDSPNRADALMMTTYYNPDTLRRIRNKGGTTAKKKRPKSGNSWRTV